MNILELVLLVCSILAVVVIFAIEIARGRGIRFATLPPPMLLFLRISLGVLFAILGVIGSLLPVLQGWLFSLLAVLVLFPQSRFAIRAVDKIEPRMPRLVAWLRRVGIGTHRDDDSMRVR